MQARLARTTTGSGHRRRRSGRLAGVAVALAALAAPAGAGPAAADASADPVRLPLAPGESAASEWEPGAARGDTTAGLVVPALDGGPVYAAVEVRGERDGDGYRGRVTVSPDGTLSVGTSTVVAGTERARTSRAVPGRVRAGDVVNVAAAFDAGGSVAVRAWPAGEAVPAWQHRSTDRSGPALGAAEHRVWSYLSRSADEPVAVTAYGAAVGAPSDGARPGPANTGVPAGTALTVHRGDLVVTTPGARIDAVDVHGFVEVRAPGVRITRSRVRGGQAEGFRGLVTVTDPAARDVVIEDSEIAPTHPSVYYDGIKGSGFTARRVDVHGVVDNIKVHGDDVRVEDSWLHDSRSFASDPAQGGGGTHNDAVQVLGGDDVAIVGNTLQGARNAALQVTQDHSAVTDLQFSRNYAEGGTCSVKLTHQGRSSLSEVTLTDNRFGGGTTYPGCAVLATSATRVAAGGNVWDDSGDPVAVRRHG